MNKTRILEYDKRIDKYEQKLAIASKKHTIVSIARLVVFLLFLFSWFWLFVRNQPIGASFGSLFVILFLWLLKKHKNLENEKLYYENILQINELEKKCCNGDFSNFNGGEIFTDIDHAYSYDIDLFGNGSLFQYLNRTITVLGKEILSNWLSETPLEEEQILDNQVAVNDLSEKLQFRQEFLTIGELYKSEENEEETISNWLNHKPFFANRVLASILLLVIPLINFTILFLVVFSFIEWSWIVFLIVVNLAIVSSRLKTFNSYYNMLSKSHLNLKKMSRLFKLVEDEKVLSGKLQKLQQYLYKVNKPASIQINRLTKYLDTLDNRNNILVGVVLNSFLLWDWQCVFRIEKWQKNHQIDYKQWLQCIANYDALISLANLKYNNPDFSYPKVSDKEFEFNVEQAGHPLLDKEIRVCNDFNINKEQRYAIVTGANMAGKSTFLRTVAVNLILAGAGSAVCAKNMKFTPLPMFSSMRTEDSLMKNESYFFAELKRLQRITEELDANKKLFIILDEILRGTNSEDKRKGSIGFVNKITQKQAHGLVATHDLELARLAEQKPNVFKALCFEVAISNNELEFDYKLQSGVTQNMNASFLMKKMGIIE